MERINLLNIIEFALKNYKDPTLNNRFGLLEYYSFTDIAPRKLATIARRSNRIGLEQILIRFDENHFFVSKEINKSEKLKFFHAVNNHELTKEEKLTIMEKLEAEGYPLIEGIYNYAVRQYVNQGIDAISKEKTRNKVLKTYEKKYGFKPTLTESVKVKQK